MLSRMQAPLTGNGSAQRAQGASCFYTVQGYSGGRGSSSVAQNQTATPTRALAVGPGGEAALATMIPATSARPAAPVQLPFGDNENW